MQQYNNWGVVVIPALGTPFCVKLKNMDQAKDIVGCEMTSGCSLAAYEKYGYKLALLFDDMGYNKPINPLASLLRKKDICGTCILIDDIIELDLDRFRKIIEYAK